MKSRGTVAVGLSGGVDSSVAALRLKNAGYEVVGVFIRVWHPDFITCTEPAERQDAMRVAATLEIPFLTCDAREAYRDDVAQVMIREYERGRTPNPDVLCNKSVKFGVFDEFRKKHGIEYLATGHYARRGDENGEPTLCTARDTAKDQSYFLSLIPHDILPSVLLPLGESVKQDVRKDASHALLPTATKPDSQGICFLGKLDMLDFLSHYITPEPGSVLDETGNIIGTHRGALFYTLGQRHGFTITEHDATRAPRYVIGKDSTNNTLTVGLTHPTLNPGTTFRLSSWNPLTKADFDSTKTYHAVLRYHSTPVRVRVTAGAEPRVELEEQSEMVSPGQLCALYEHDRCIGGGIIEPYE